MVCVLFFVLCIISCPSPLSLLLAIAVHEAGHITAACLLGWGAPTVHAGAVGLRLSYHGTHAPLQSIAVSLAGSLAGAAFAIVPLVPEEIRLYSAGLSLVNLLPILGLDGGGVLLCALESVMLPDRAYRLTRIFSVASVLLLWALSLAVQMKAGANLSLLAISVYLTVSTLSEGK